MRVAMVSLFPEMLGLVRDLGVTGRAVRDERLSLTAINPRDYTLDRHRSVDDRPYGGGPGMVMRPEPLAAALEAGREFAGDGATVIYLSPQGQRFDHGRAKELAELPGMVLLAGRYEGVDERLIRSAVDEELSIGDYVLSGGELAALVVIDAVARLLPGVLGHEDSAAEDSFAQGLLDCPHFTRPEQYEGQDVPDVLLSGDHAAIRRWRLKQALGRTWERRPDLLDALEQKRQLTAEEQKLLAEYQQDAV
ncbi:tRNA (guanosine(37)-N1)-methyltransferase TrmD [Congregibacter litoralis]|uniref:tRNA (guanine-N(1)-)-methyltransferase n=1 Tax=Congregibacter litoralis KT71 TaxID=314285 RepID=A4ADG2_9GAMM|nr:tRNA (guanosine(37)-N1)-methyltransferase TrmD [Congregibacter litoralis]EAQ95960.1 tRNA (Guanine37-N(1)-) methyltransferase [Congregibacter litoralis KT71]